MHSCSSVTHLCGHQEPSCGSNLCTYTYTFVICVYFDRSPRLTSIYIPVYMLLLLLFSKSYALTSICSYMCVVYCVLQESSSDVSLYLYLHVCCVLQESSSDVSLYLYLHVCCVLQESSSDVSLYLYLHVCCVLQESSSDGSLYLCLHVCCVLQ